MSTLLANCTRFMSSQTLVATLATIPLLTTGGLPSPAQAATSTLPAHPVIEQPPN